MRSPGWPSSSARRSASAAAAGSRRSIAFVMAKTDAGRVSAVSASTSSTLDRPLAGVGRQLAQLRVRDARHLAALDVGLPDLAADPLRQHVGRPHLDLHPDARRVRRDPATQLAASRGAVLLDPPAALLDRVGQPLQQGRRLRDVARRPLLDQRQRRSVRAGRSPAPAAGRSRRSTCPAARNGCRRTARWTPNMLIVPASSRARSIAASSGVALGTISTRSVASTSARELAQRRRRARSRRRRGAAAAARSRAGLPRRAQARDQVVDATGPTTSASSASSA